MQSASGNDDGHVRKSLCLEPGSDMEVGLEKRADVQATNDSSQQRSSVDVDRRLSRSRATIPGDPPRPKSRHRHHFPAPGGACGIVCQL